MPIVVVPTNQIQLSGVAPVAEEFTTPAPALIRVAPLVVSAPGLVSVSGRGLKLDDEDTRIWLGNQSLTKQSARPNTTLVQVPSNALDDNALLWVNYKTQETDDFWNDVVTLYDFSLDFAAPYDNQKNGNFPMNDSGNVTTVARDALHTGARSIQRSTSFPWLQYNASPTGDLLWYNNDVTFDCWIYLDSSISGADNQQPIACSNRGDWMWEARYDSGNGNWFNYFYWYNGASFDVNPGGNLPRMEAGLNHCFLSYQQSTNRMKFGVCSMDSGTGSTWSLNRASSPAILYGSGEYGLLGIGQANYRDWAIKGGICAFRHTKALRWGMDASATGNTYPEPPHQFPQEQT